MNKTTNMTEGSILGLVLPFTLPLLLANIGQQLYQIADAAIVGRGVDLKALAAVGSTDWSYWLILWTVTGLTQAFATFISRYFGQKRYDRMNKAIAMSAVLSLIIGSVLTVIGLLCAKPLLRLLDTPADIIDGAGVYLTTMIGGTLIVTAYNMSASILRAFGNGRSPLIAMMIAAALNIGLDLLFVLYFKWGIFGAALASVIGQAVAFVYSFMQIRKIEYVSLTKTDFKPDTRLMAEMLRFGLPIAFQFIVIAVSGIVLQSTLNQQGSDYIAGFTATNKLYGLLESTALSLGLAFATFFSQNYGAGKYERVKKGVRTGMLLSAGMAVVVMAIIIPSGKLLLQLFIDMNKDGSGAVLEIAYRYLFIMALFLIIIYPIHIYRNALQGIGNALFPMLSGFAESIVRIVMAKVVIRALGIDTLFFIEPSAWLAALLISALPYYYYRRTKLKEVQNERT